MDFQFYVFNIDTEGSKGGPYYAEGYKGVGLSYGTNFGEYGYFQMAGFANDEGPKMYGIQTGFGVQRRFRFGDRFLLQSAVYPYIGWSSMTKRGVATKVKEAADGTTEQTNEPFKETKETCTYGLATNFQVGVRMSGSAYFTVGYYVSMPKFQTNRMFDYGTFSVGLSVLM